MNAMRNLSWNQLFDELRPIISKGGPQLTQSKKLEIMTLLRSYESVDADFERYCTYDSGEYTKNLVQDFGDNCNVIIMCWSPLQTSKFHGHEQSRCFVKCLSGVLIEQQVAYPSGGEDEYVAMKEKILKRDDVSYIDDSIGLHKMFNRSNVRPCVSLHIYMPAYKRCRIFTEDEASKSLSLANSHVNDVSFNNRLRF